ncbi:MAG: FtsX-like permease family protein [Candidatus Bathyarchaeota archaeon]|nr:FtsX-like permease family protein [Candidatus Bathyarchaeota archaeon]
MSKAAFPVNDLLRRKLQTGLTTITLTLSVASTLFLLLFSRRISWEIISAENVLTHGLSNVFSQFLLFIGVLIFAVGAVVTSFIVFLIMKQRTQDFGLIKAAGCPNGLVFGYFMTELLAITFLASVLGVVLGFAADFVANSIIHFQAYQTTIDLWFALLIFATYFVLAITFGTKPILDAARVSPIKALSPVKYFGLTMGNRFKPLSRAGIRLKIASRSLSRRQSPTVRIFILLSVVFVLLTVSISGGVIANNTSLSWVEDALGSNVVAIAHESMGIHYRQLLAKFSGAAEVEDFNYLNPEYAVPRMLLDSLEKIQGIEIVDARLILKIHIQEVSNFTIDPETLVTLPVGNSREGDSLIIGVNPKKVTANWYLKGRFLSAEETSEAVIGDSIAQTMFSPDPKAGIHFSNPFFQGIRVQNETFRIVGVCVDPVNNGKVTYVSIEKLQKLTGIYEVNIILVKIDSTTDRSSVLAQIENEANEVNAAFSVFALEEVLQKNLDFLGSAWSTAMLLPLFSLISAALCLIGYTMLTIEEQRQEFAVLRAMGAKPKTVVTIVAIQNVIVLLLSFGVGISLGVIITLMILMPQPLVTSFTIIEILAWLLACLLSTFLLSLWPAVRFAKKPILKIMS